MSSWSLLLLSLRLFLVGNTTTYVNIDQINPDRWKRREGMGFKPHMEQVALDKRKVVSPHHNL